MNDQIVRTNIIFRNLRILKRINNKEIYRFCEMFIYNNKNVIIIIGKQLVHFGKNIPKTPHLNNKIERSLLNEKSR